MTKTVYIYPSTAKETADFMLNNEYGCPSNTDSLEVIKELIRIAKQDNKPVIFHNAITGEIFDLDTAYNLCFKQQMDIR